MNSKTAGILDFFNDLCLINNLTQYELKCLIENYTSQLLPTSRKSSCDFFYEVARALKIYHQFLYTV